MTQAEKIEALKLLTKERDLNVLSAFLSIAGDKVCRAAYPFDDSVTAVPKQYEYIQLEIAQYMLNKRGAEGQTAHSENGISRSYESGGVPDSMLRDIVPHCKVI